MKAYISSAVLLSIAVSVVVAAFALLALQATDVGGLFGSSYASEREVIKLSLTYLILAYLVQVNCSIIESAQVGFHEQYKTNLLLAVGAIPTIIAIYLMASGAASVTELLIAATLPAVLLRAMQALWLIARDGKYSVSFRSARLSVCRELVGQGSLYAISGSLGNFLAHVLPVILVGRALEADSAASFVLSMTVVTLVAGVVSVLIGPVAPAVAASVAKGSRDAIIALRRGRLLVMCFVVGIATLLITVGESIFSLWVGNAIHMDLAIRSAVSAYIILSSWEVLSFSVIVGLGRVAHASALILARTVLGAGAIILAVDEGGRRSALLDHEWVHSVGVHRSDAPIDLQGAE